MRCKAQWGAVPLTMLLAFGIYFAVGFTLATLIPVIARMHRRTLSHHHCTECGKSLSLRDPKICRACGARFDAAPKLGVNRQD